MSFLVKEQPFLIAIDFDNTICIPTTGLENPSGYQPVPHIREFLFNLYNNYNCRFFLYTSRSGQLYTMALDFLIEQALDKYFILPTSPEYHLAVPFTSGLKPYADFYVDDLAVGAPLVHYPVTSVTTNKDFFEYLNQPLEAATSWAPGLPAKTPGTKLSASPDNSTAQSSTGTPATSFHDYINLFQVEYAIVSRITNFCLIHNISLPNDINR